MHPLLNSYDLIVFDFDGLLVNTEHLHFRAYKEMLEGRGCHFTISFIDFASHAHVSSSALKEWILKTYPHLHSIEWSVLYEEKQALYQKLLEAGGLGLMPGVEKLLTLLKGRRMCVATNSRAQQIALVKKHLPILNLIPIFVTREDYTHAKPAPDAYLKALEVCGKPGDRIVGFEDTLRGIKALIGAQIDPVLICDEHHPQCKDPLVKKLTYFRSFEDLLSQG